MFERVEVTMNDVLRAVTVAMVWRAAWHAHIVEPSGHTTEVLNELSSLGYSWTIRPWHGWSPVVLPNWDALCAGTGRVIGGSSGHMGTRGP